MKKSVLTLTSVIVIAVIGLITWLVIKPSSGIYGTWLISDNVELVLRHGDTFSFVTDENGSITESLRGAFTYNADLSTVEFRSNDNALFTWENISLGDGELTLTSNGATTTIFKLDVQPIIAQTLDAQSDGVVMIYPFNQALTNSLNEEGNFVELWQGFSSFRKAHAGFRGAKLYEQLSGNATYPFITIDDWSSTRAFQSFSRVFQGDAVLRAEYLSEKDGIGAYREVERLGTEHANSDHVNVIVLLDIPDDLHDAYMSQWDMFSDFIASQDGYQSAVLYRSLEGSDSPYAFFVRSTWESEQAFVNVAQSEFFQVIVGEGTYKSESAMYRIAANDPL